MILKDKYEISVWEDYLANQDDTFYSEKKLAIIGSNTMTAQWRAVMPQLVENINGTNTFTFKMYYTYIDTETGKRIDNPFTKLLVNERKIKVHWKNKWYDFIIKNISENSGDKSITYTCKDLYVNELSKTGFDLVFSDELENNSGTVKELGDRVVEGTDWTIENGDTIRQKIEEPVYDLITAAEINTKEGVVIPAGNRILVFYSVAQGGRPVQVWYDPNQEYLKENGSMLVTSGDCYTFSEDNDYNENNIVFPESLEVSNEYRAERLVNSQLTKYDELLDRYVSIYEDKNGNQYHSFVTTETDKPFIVPNLVSNGKDFANLDTWKVVEGNGTPTFELLPMYTSDKSLEDYFKSASSYIKLPANTKMANTSLEKNIYLLDGIQSGDSYILRYKAYSGSYNGTLLGIDFFNGIYIDDKKITSEKLSAKDEWCTLKLIFNETITKKELLTKKIQLVFSYNTEVYIKEVEFFKEQYGEDGSLLVPNSIDISSVIKVYRKYYNPEQNESAIAANDSDAIIYAKIHDAEESWDEVVPVYNGYEKIRSIKAEKTNRFDIIQTLAETFECWAEFNIKHDEETGAILIEEGKPQKTIKFVETKGQKTGLGFTYGLDLKTISRSIISDQISTKVIVSNNSNEYGENGFCSIARSEENYPKENFILNFDYYIQQGLLDGGQVNKDLYLSATLGDNDIGYYPKLREINTEYDSNAERISQYQMALIKQESLVNTYSDMINANGKEITELGADIAAFAGVSSITEQSTYIASLAEKDQQLKSWLITYNQLVKNNIIYQAYLDQVNKSVIELNALIEDLEISQGTLLEDKKELNQKFNTRYSNYIQEGTWISEDYVDDTLYYLDAQSVAYTSSRPQISYNISVMRLSALEEYKNRIFRLGDIGFIQDVEFFGYEKTVVGDDRFDTPYREQILISEVISNFDEPDKDTFKVQNYKTQFEDLFQRITATTQSLQYHSGEYQKVASIINADGTIKSETFAASMANNNNLVWSSVTDSVTTGNDGITVRDLSDPNKIVKLTSGGLFISIDGGVNWKNAVRGEGVSTRWLTAGKINVNDITIYSDTGNYPTFRWDALGLNAYQLFKDTDGNITGTNTNKFVRFDRFGIYGRSGAEEATAYIPENEDAIWTDEDVKYALTWKGFMLNTDGGAVKITSQDDIGVYDAKGTNRVKIGRLGNGDYGLRLSDSNSTVIMETDTNGQLWLRDKLQIGLSSDSYDVSIGNIGNKEGDTTEHGGRVIDANNRFIVYEDGHMIAESGSFKGHVEAESGSFTGTIIATGGTIGGLEIEEITNNLDPTVKLIIDKDVVKISYRISESKYSLVESIDEEDREDLSGYYILITNEKGEQIYESAEGSIYSPDEFYYVYSEETNEYVSKYVFTKDEFIYGEKFKVSNDGILIAKDAIIEGQINATSGIFSGEINATAGDITGILKIGNIILDGTSSENKIYYSDDVTKFSINNNGVISAKEIILGSGAKIDDYLKLGNAYIYNPEKNSGNFISIKDDEENILINIKEDGNIQLSEQISIFPEGKMSIGELKFDGINSSISASSNNNPLWEITDKVARFQDIEIGGSIFKPGTVSAAGGQFIFKDVITQEQIQQSEESPFIGEYWYYGYSKENGDKSIDIRKYDGKNKEDFTKDYYLSLGTKKDDETNILTDFLIGVNSTDKSNLGTLSLPSNSLSISRISLEYNDNNEPIVKNEPVLILGDLKDKISFYNEVDNIGLWSSNVFLEGFLTTHYIDGEEDGYAGMGTGESNSAIFNIATTKVPEAGIIDNSKIIFWGGAQGTTNSAIQNAPFQVSANGTLYAQNAIIENSTYVGGTFTAVNIVAASLQTPKIIGTGSAEENGLIIENVHNGIIFTCGDFINENEYECEFRLTKGSLYTNLPYKGTSITLTGNIEALMGKTEELETNKIIIDKKSILLSNSLTTEGNFDFNVAQTVNIANEFSLNSKYKYVKNGDNYDIYIN